MLVIVLLVLFTLVMGVWLLTMLGAVNTPGGAAHASGWLAFFGVLILGIVVFLAGFGVVVWRVNP